MKPTAYVLFAALLCHCDAPEPSPPTAAKETTPPPAPTPPASQALRFRTTAKPEPFAGVGQRIPVASGALVIDLADGTRVTATPGTQLWAFAHASTLLLVSGELQITRVASAQQTAATPVRIASLAGVVEPNLGAELAFRVELEAEPLSYRAQLSLARGSVTWLAPQEHAVVKETLLIAGEQLPMPAPGVQWLSGPLGQAVREQRYAALRAVRLSADLDALLEAALSEQQELRQKGHALLAQVRAQHASAEPASSPRASQRELVSQAQRRELQKKQLLSAAERSLLRALVACAASDVESCTRLEQWRGRFAERLAQVL